MRPLNIMLIAGEASGDRLAAELVVALRELWWQHRGEADVALPPLQVGSGPTFFGAGGSAMREAGVEIVEDMTHRAVIGVSDVLRRLFEFSQLMNRLVKLAAERQPDVIVCVDYGGFNLRFQSRIGRLTKSFWAPFNNWRPRLVQFVSPQVWGSRPKRALRMEENLDLLISILPFEREWFARRAPRLKVAFVGHPLIGRHAGSGAEPPSGVDRPSGEPLVALLPGSRRGELGHHLPVLIDAVKLIRQQVNCRFKMIVPSEELAGGIRETAREAGIDLVVGQLDAVLREATIAISKTGTITLELALFRVPAVTFYKTTWTTFVIAKQVVTVKWLSMPNLLAGEAVFPELVQDDATPKALAEAAVSLLRDEAKRGAVVRQLGEVVQQLGEPDAPKRAAAEIFKLLD